MYKNSQRLKLTLLYLFWRILPLILAKANFTIHNIVPIITKTETKIGIIFSSLIPMLKYHYNQFSKEFVDLTNCIPALANLSKAASAWLEKSTTLGTTTGEVESSKR